MLVAFCALTPQTLSAQRQGAASPQGTVVPMVGGSDSVPPVVTISPGTETTGTSPISVTITWCDDHTLSTGTRHILLNNADVTSSFNYTTASIPGCGAAATSTGSISLVSGANSFHAYILDNSLNRGDGYATYTYSTVTYGVSVTPDGQAVTAHANASNSVTFHLNNTGDVSEDLSFAVTCSGTITGCPTSLSTKTLPYPGYDSVVVAFQAGPGGDTGTVQLKATRVGDASVTDIGSFKVTSQWVNYLSVDKIFVRDAEDASLCANSCFAATYSQSTVPYYSMDQARQVTLAYNSDRDTPRPFVYADVHLASGVYSNLQQYTLEVRSNGADLPFANGEAQLHFRADPTNPSRVVHLAGQLVLDDYATGSYPVDIVVTAVYADHTEPLTMLSRVSVVNARTSPIAKGWTIAGLQQLYVQPDGSALITDGTGSATYYTCESHTVPCQPGSFATVDHTTLTTVTTGGVTVYLRSYRDSTKVEFDNTGRMQEVTDRFLNRTTYYYDALGRVNKISDPYNPSGYRETCVWYNSTWGIDSIREPGAGPAPCLGRTTKFAVTNDSSLQSIQDPDGRSTRFSYDGTGRLLAVTGRTGGTTTFAYNATSLKLDSIISPAVAVDTLGSGATVVKSPVVRYSPWQTRGVPQGATNVTPFNPFVLDSVYAVVTDPEHHSTKYSADQWGQPLVTTDPLGRVTIVKRADKLPVSVTYPSGLKDSTAYTDGLPTYIAKAGRALTTISYGTYGLPRLISADGQPIRIFVYGAYGRDSLETVAGMTTQYTGDALSRPVKVTDSHGHFTVLHYDDVSANLDSTAAYDSTGQLISAARTWFDSFGRDSVYRATGGTADTTLYDEINRVIRKAVPGPGTGERVTTVAYDTLGGVVTTDAKSQTFRDSVNALGWVVKHTDPAGKSVIYHYDRDGLTTLRINREGKTVSTLYDAVHRDTLRTGPDVTPAHFSYNTSGTITAGWNNVSRDSIFTNATTGWTDSVVTILAGGHRFRRSYAHTSAMQLDSVDITEPTPGSGTGLHGRKFVWNDSTGLLEQVRAGGAQFRIHYNDEFLPDSLEYPGQITQANWYSSTHQPIDALFGSPSLDSLLSVSYGYDSLGRVIESDRQIKSGTGLEIGRYQYDALGQLSWMGYKHTTSAKTTCKLLGGPPRDDFGPDCWDSYTGTKDHSVAFTYDSVGSMRMWYDTTRAYWTEGTYITGDRLTSWANNTYTYDYDGNRETKTNGSSTVTYHWTADGLLDSVIAGPSHVGYEYNAFGRLVARSRNGKVERYFLWDQDQLLAELDTTWTRVAEYVHAPGRGAPLELFVGPSGAARFYAIDVLGNVAGVFDSTGAIVERPTYSVWGRMDSLQTALADTNRLRWKGLLWEGDSTQLYYVRARWYDPASNRFISEDPGGPAAGINPYLYAGNDAINHSDPSGMYWDSDCSADICIPRGGGDFVDQGVCSFYLPCNNGDITEGDIDPMVTEVKLEALQEKLKEKSGRGQACPHSNDYVYQFDIPTGTVGYVPPVTVCVDAASNNEPVFELPVWNDATQATDPAVFAKTGLNQAPMRAFAPCERVFWAGMFGGLVSAAGGEVPAAGGAIGRWIRGVLWSVAGSQIAGAGGCLVGP